MRTPNAEQIAYWNGPSGASWVADQDLRDRSLAPFGEAALGSARVKPGERVLDVGCGCGATSLALAEAVGPSGHVLGLDVSEPMLAHARHRARGLPQLTFRSGDAGSAPFEGDAHLLFSRFGVMFFEDPAASFAHLRTALAAGGRLAFVCWRGLAENPWLEVPFSAAQAVLPRASPVLEGPGPLAFADPAQVRSILERAGFTEIAVAPFDHVMPLGDGRGLDAAAAEAMTLGPAARLLKDVDEPTRQQVGAAIRQALAPHLRGQQLTLGAGAWVVTAKRGAAW